MTPDALETRTREIGRDIFRRVAGQSPMPLSPAWIDERAMAFSMRDESVKVQLFRLVDTLPSLKSDRAVTRHLKEYFATIDGRLGPALSRVARFVPEDGSIGTLVAKAARFNAERLARRFIAGTDVDQTLKTIEQLRRDGLGFTIDLLGEAILSESEAKRYQQQYLTFIDGITRRASVWTNHLIIDHGPFGPTPAVNVSVKLSSLYSQFDPIAPDRTSSLVRERLRPILQLARSRGAFVNIDMEQHAFKDLTLRIFQEAFSEPAFLDWPDVGIAIQAYLKSCGDDLRTLAAWAQRRGTPVWVRLVKGAYWDYETVIAAQNNWPVPVWQQKHETDANFEAMARFLAENSQWLRPAIGSHNVRSIAHALALEESLGLAPGSIEFQMLYGMADPIKTSLAQMGRRVRVYTPFGELLPGMAYLVRRLLENTSNQSFVRAGFLDRVSIEELLVNPTQKVIRRNPPIAKPVEFVNEPLTDFSVAEHRDAMSEALAEVGSMLGKATDLPVINGKRGGSGPMVRTFNPSHNTQLVGSFVGASREDAERAIDAATRAFPHWRDTPVEKRVALLRKSAAILRRRRFELAAWEVYECGKQWREADADVAETIDYCEFYAAEMERLNHPRTRNVPGEENSYFYEARGPAVTIAPWNFPMAILCGMTAAALVAGNPTIMKPAEQSSLVAARLMEVFEEAGFPAGVIQYLPGIGEEIGPVLTSHRNISIVAFTGSRNVGLSINELCGHTPPGQLQIKKVITELGGKNGSIIDEDADLDEAVAAVAAGAFGYAGQKCSACSRAIVLDGVYHAFLSRLIEATRSLRIGPAEDPGTFVGPVIDRTARDRILKTIDVAGIEAKLAYAGELGKLADEGWYIAPHIFEAPPQSALAREEIFGPVLSLIRATDMTDALRLANDSAYALTGGIHSRSPANIERARREFRVGNLYINRRITGALVDRQPFGGFKLSGTGPKAGGPDYLVQFLHARCVTENTLRHGFAPTGE